MHSWKLTTVHMYVVVNFYLFICITLYDSSLMSLYWVFELQRFSFNQGWGAPVTMSDLRPKTNEN